MRRSKQAVSIARMFLLLGAFQRDGFYWEAVNVARDEYRHSWNLYVAVLDPGSS